MKINKQVLKKLASLSKINFSSKEEDDMLEDFNKLFQFINTLDEVDTSGVEPLTHVHENSNILREDKVDNMLSKADMLNNAPKSNSDYIKVPKVLDK
jgi:aspartyl-tRNA(Asn)/glutamyl-tRNA(Gln) amidotransferase subunit C